MLSNKANSDAMIVMKKDGNMVSASNIDEAKKMANEGWSVFINKSGTKIVAEAAKSPSKKTKKKKK